ncbi:transcriptional regulator with XRE-family HTH domain [Spirosoma lacussanchae]|uniref:helix-turn-helix transcriptional regulator n=1 Tax=Spirosoma lacussanchae TaxID=1884249 RepID=UPI0011097CCE|nr:helix-turn-helix transcriptional regulator [Spirosoma lacussanchae]
MDKLISELIARRNTLRLTQEYLAELAGVSLRTVKAIESGAGNPRVSTLIKLADVLGMELRWIVKPHNL